jgi:glycosyltransferase involved in cell wall biosynthesis
LKFCVYRDGKVEELTDKDLEWLLKGENTTEVYLKKMGRLEKEEDKSSAENKDDPEVEEITVPTPETCQPLAQAYAYSTSRYKRMFEGVRKIINSLPVFVRFFVWIPALILFAFFKVFSGIRMFFLNVTGKSEKAQLRKVQKQVVPLPAELNEKTFPFKNGDVLFSMGWMHSGKEEAYAIAKEKINIKIVYCVYDLILLLDETQHFYISWECESFKKYFEWISYNCDFLITGGKTALKDAQEWQRKHFLPITNGMPIEWGNNILETSADFTIDDIKKKYKITDKYIISVGTIDNRKNYDTVINAYYILAERYERDLLWQLIIVSGTVMINDIVDAINVNPNIKGLIKIISPSDAELDLLYKNACFAILPSLYEGYSLTLPEALNYGKMCIANDIPSIQEIGQSFIAYVPYKDRTNPFVWAEKLKYFFDCPEEIKKYEDKIQGKGNWRNKTWADCSKKIQKVLSELNRAKLNESIGKTIWIDITLTWFNSIMNGNITGIARTELMMIRYIPRFYKNVKFFSYDNAYGIKVSSRESLSEIFNSN